MKVIGIDTTTKAFCMALVQDEEVLERLIIEEREYRTEQFIVYLQGMLESQSLHRDDIDGYAISIGPGSLTGVRVGLSFCKGLGYAMGKPVVGIPTLYAIAYRTRERTSCICPVLLTRRERLFWALYLFVPEERTLVDTSCTTADKFLQMLPAREILFLGTGALGSRALIEQKMGNRAFFEEKSIAHADPATIAMLGIKHIRKGNVPPLDELEPIYL